jgi:hypothetical protein
MAIQQPPPVAARPPPPRRAGEESSDHELLQDLVNEAVLAESSNEA